MLTLSKISINELPKLVELSYAGDFDLLEKYHVKVPLLPHQGVELTVSMVKEARKKLDIQNYKVIYNKQPVGYVTVSPNHLFSFSINKQYRKPEILKEWFDRIVEVLGNRFVCRLYPNNTRAIGWLEKCGMEETMEGLDNCISLIYKK